MTIPFGRARVRSGIPYQSLSFSTSFTSSKVCSEKASLTYCLGGRGGGGCSQERVAVGNEMYQPGGTGSLRAEGRGMREEYEGGRMSSFKGVTVCAVRSLAVTRVGQASSAFHHCEARHHEVRHCQARPGSPHSRL